MKIISAFTICLILVLSNFIFSAFTTALADDGRSNNAIVKKAGIFSFAGYHMKDDDGRLSGYGIEFLNLVSEYSHLSFQYVGYDNSWSEMQTMLENGEIDVVTSARRNSDREKKFDFSLPIGRNKTVLSVQVNNTKFERGNYASYDGMVIGIVKDSSQNDSIISFAEEKGFDYTTVEKADSDELAAALQKGEIDAILSSNLRKPENEKVLDIIEEADIYAIVRKGDTELLKEINYAIEQMDINEGDWQNVLFYRYYGTNYSSALSFTEREKAYIERVVSGEKTITATALGDRQPYSYVEDGQLKGIMPDYFAELMKLAGQSAGHSEGLPFTLVVPQDHDDYHNIVNSNGVNVVIDSLGSDGNVESGVHGFNSNSYMTATMARVTRQDHNGEIKTVAVSVSHGKEIIKPEFLEGYTVKTYPTGDDAMRAVLNREADAAYVYAYAAQLFVNHDLTNSLYYGVMDGMSTTFSMYVNENTDHELITILNKCIKQTSDDTLNQLVLKYTSYTIGDMDFWQYLQANPGIIIAVVLIIAVIVCVIIGLYLRGRWNQKTLRLTEQSNKRMAEQLAIVRALSRDYTNVYAINEEKSTAKILKIEGNVTGGINKYSEDEHDYGVIIDAYIRSRVHPDDREELAKALALDNVVEKLQADGEYFGNYRILSGGEVHYLQYNYVKIPDNDNGRGDFILAGFRNIDEAIRNEQEQKNALSEALAQAQYANKAKTTFLNSMSHDIRTPMNAIIGFTTLATTHIDDKEQIRDYLGKIMTSGNHLLSLINDVLDMSRIESGKVKIEEKETSLPEVMHDLKTIVQADVKAKQLDFYVDTLDVTNETIICDKLRLNQVLLNILSNAMKYTKPGGTVSVRVVQSAAQDEGHACYEFSVKDTGIGMSKEFLKHVFEPFEREQTSTVSGIQGTGLGLAITKNIVDMMGGSISVESEEGKGSEFTVKFIFKVADVSADNKPLSELVDMKALVVDDDVNSCESVSKMLATMGMRPDWTTLGSEALSRTDSALKSKEPYGVYLTDWLMPDMNGMELVKKLRKKIGKDIPIIVLTAYDWTDIEKEAREAGVTAFCSKPIFLSDLRNVLTAPYSEKGEGETGKPEIRFDGKKILLVEDNELNQEIAQSILEEAGFIIDTADDGSVAVEKMKEKPAGTYDMILMDVQMPIMNGYEATRAIRALADPAKASIPIVAMTANAFEEDKKEALDSGMNGYASKPIDIEKLMKTLQDILK
ncbi:MAG: response regulator [Clostridia bacterium]|nr:response regulator [Clostridia bacterium]